jgi:hypothetical protein
MSRKIIPVSHPQLTSLDLDAFVRQAKALNQQNRKRFTTPFPKHASCPKVPSDLQAGVGYHVDNHNP